jgi:hypothetical protein
VWSRPKLSDACGRHFHYRDLIQCGDTWHALNRQGRTIANLPREAATWLAMRTLCETILDPVWDRFGKVTITYAFASAELDGAVRQRAREEGRLPNTTRNRDQHAGHELNRNGKPVCSRLGLAVDFKVEGTPSDEIARWITGARLPFDRLYYYGDERPLHVSAGPDNSRYRWNRRRP